MNSSVKIHPSLLAANISHIKKEIDSVASAEIESIHFDIGDAIFVPSKMLSPSLLKNIPTELPIDVHLMVQNPSKYFPKILKYKQVAAVAFHIESSEDIRENIAYLRQRGIKVGLAILHSTPGDYLDQYLLEIDYILVMTIKGGFSGTPFIEEVLPKILEIRQKRPKLPILVDGGINLRTAQLCANQ